VHTTSGRTGLLVFIAVRERRAELVGDTGMAGVVLGEWSRQLEAAIGDGPAAVAKVLASFAPALATAAPRRADDANELPDAPIRS
jgi:putative membrane protein